MLEVQVRKPGSTWTSSDVETLLTLSSSGHGVWYEAQADIRDSLPYDDFILRVAVSDDTPLDDLQLYTTVALDDLEIVCATLGNCCQRIVVLPTNALQLQINKNTQTNK